jgi:hypothetical protein
MRLKLFAAAALGAAIMAPACALAASTIAVDVALPQAGPTAVPWTDTINVPFFNSSLGTLTGVEILLTDTTSVAIQVTNNNSAPVNFTGATASIPLTVTGPGLGSGGLSQTITANLSGTANPGLNNFTPSSQTVVVPDDIITTNLSQFETGSPSVTYVATAGLGTYSGAGTTNLDFGGTANVTGSFEVIYDYTSVPGVPEPATWAFMMLGVGAIGAAMRGRRKAGLALAAV